MPPEENKASDTPQPVPESQQPVPEPPAPEPVQTAPEPTPAPVEVVPTPPEVSVEVQTVHIPANEPFDSLPQESEQATQGKPAPTPPASGLPTGSEPLPTPQPLASIIAPILNLAREMLIKARATIQSRKRKKLEKIMEVVNAKGKITNDQVEKLLHVSDATATRYLAQLEKEGKVKQEGKTGKGVSYLKI